MGKVGSTTVVQSLRAAGASDVFHVHFLSGNPSERIRARQKLDPAVPKHLFIEQVLQRRVQRPDFYCKIITLVRDPIAREISDLFENYRWQAAEVTGDGGHIDPQRALDYLHEHLESLDYYDYALNWFDRELKEVFDVDVFAYPFNKEAGYAHIESEKAEILVVRLENLSELIPTVVSDFVDRKLEVIPARRRTDSRDGETYRRVKRKLALSPEVCRKIYATPLVRHFYSEHMISKFTNRWSRYT